MVKSYYVYIITNQFHTVLYIGFTSDLLRRTAQHQVHYYPNSFSHKYNTTKLVYYETYSTAMEAIVREKQLKKWNRSWKIRLVNEMNPSWEDLAKTF